MIQPDSKRLVNDKEIKTSKNVNPDRNHSKFNLKNVFLSFVAKRGRCTSTGSFSTFLDYFQFLGN